MKPKQKLITLEGLLQELAKQEKVDEMKKKEDEKVNPRFRVQF